MKWCRKHQICSARTDVLLTLRSLNQEEVLYVLNNLYYKASCIIRKRSINQSGWKLVDTQAKFIDWKNMSLTSENMDHTYELIALLINQILVKVYLYRLQLLQKNMIVLFGLNTPHY